jgi:two-component sensor histidine kinase
MAAERNQCTEMRRNAPVATFQDGYPGEVTTIPAMKIDRALFALWGLFWLLMIAVGVQDNHGDHGIQWWEPYLWEGSSCLVATVWLVLERYGAKRWDEYLDVPWQWFARHLAWMPAVIATFIPAIYAIREGVYALTTETYEHEPWSFIFIYESIKLVLFAGLWLGIIFGLESFARWRHEREQLLLLQKHLAESQLAQLKTQLQPHFLFNALNTISSLMQVDVERADRLLTRLADLLRSSLQAGARDMTSLREEIELLDLYAQIMQERFAGHVSLTWKVAEDALDAQIPTMLLQPLLENAFKHGVERSRNPVSVLVAAEKRGEELRVTVFNSDSALSQTPSNGIGLRNCRERLDVIYGGRASLRIENENGGVAANLSIPLKRP